MVNKRNLIKKVILFGVTFFILMQSSCIVLQPRVEGIKDVKIEEFKKDGIIVSIMIKVKNPNNLNFKVKTVDINLLVNNVDMGNLYLNKSIKIKKHSEDIYKFTLETKYKGLIGSLLTSVFSGVITGGISFKLKGNMVINKTFFYNYVIPIDYTTTLSLKDFPIDKLTK